MPRLCSVCSAKRRDEIDRALVDRTETFLALARRYRLSRPALYRHYAEHLPATMAKASEAKEEVRADDLLAQARTLQQRAQQILDRNDAVDDRVALRAVRELRGILDLLGRLLGELGDGPAVFNIAVSTEWRGILETIQTALAPFPEARVRVAQLLMRAAGGPVAVRELPAVVAQNGAKRPRRIA